MSLTSEYLLFVFITSWGVLQLIAAFAQLKGLLFFRKRAITYIVAILAIGGAFGWFFGWDNRLDEKIMHTGLEGRQQFFYFNLAALAALVFTLIVSSIVNSRGIFQSKGREEVEPGLGSLKQMSYFKAIRRSLTMTKWPEELKRGRSNLMNHFRAMWHFLKVRKGENE
jgi:hypothetical protein